MRFGAKWNADVVLCLDQTEWSRDVCEYVRESMCVCVCVCVVENEALEWLREDSGEINVKKEKNEKCGCSMIPGIVGGPYVTFMNELFSLLFRHKNILPPIKMVDKADSPILEQI